MCSMRTQDDGVLSLWHAFALRGVLPAARRRPNLVRAPSLPSMLRPCVAVVLLAAFLLLPSRAMASTGAIVTDENKDAGSWGVGYTGAIRVFEAPYDGFYRLEAWGGKGGDTPSGSVGGAGGYTYGFVQLDANDKLFVVVGGGAPVSPSGNGNTSTGGFNGGGNSCNGGGLNNDGGGEQYAAGGGATHFASLTGELSILSGSPETVAIVAGGGGGAGRRGGGQLANGGAGGGKEGQGGKLAGGNNGAPGGGGTQVDGGASGDSGAIGRFGAGASYSSTKGKGCGAGGGWRGGGVSGGFGNSSGGGSGRVGGANCVFDEDGVTVSSGTFKLDESDANHVITGASYVGGSTGAKSCPVDDGNGYAQITLLARTSFSYDDGMHVFAAPADGTYMLEAWGASGGGGDPTGTTAGSRAGVGGYSWGTIQLEKDDVVYVYVGQRGMRGTSASYNGGAGGGSATSGSGGGMTHFSLTQNPADQAFSWDAQGTLLVAGGGAGADDYDTPAHAGSYSDGSTGQEDDGSGGNGGGAAGTAGYANGIMDSSQSPGGNQNGLSGSATQGWGSAGNGDAGGGGGGWWGGAGGSSDDEGGGGGSGFVASEAFVSANRSRLASGDDPETHLGAGETYAWGEYGYLNREGGSAPQVGDGYARVTLVGGVISYDANGGYDAPEGRTVDNGQVYTVSVVTPRRLGWRFLGWSTKKTSATPDHAYDPGSSFVVNGAVNLYAIWSPDYDSSSWEVEGSATARVFTAPISGTYKLEAWGASGGGNDPADTTVGSRAGAGGYSWGTIKLEKGDVLYVFTGGRGVVGAGVRYNGGGGGGNATGTSGGGMTHFSLTENLVSSDVSWNPAGTLLVAGGGGGSDDCGGGVAGGYSAGDTEQTDDGSGGDGGGVSGATSHSNGLTSASRGAGGNQDGSAGAGTQGAGDPGVPLTNSGGAGGGWWGGAGGTHGNEGGGGGSGFVASQTFVDAYGSLLSSGDKPQVYLTAGATYAWGDAGYVNSDGTTAPQVGDGRARITLEGYTVVFDAGGGTFAPEASLRATMWDDGGLPRPTVTRTYHRQTGWSDSSSSAVPSAPVGTTLGEIISALGGR